MNDAVREIFAKLGRKERLQPDDALLLAAEAPVHDLCSLANERRRDLFQDKAFFVYNQHLNFTNICQNACRFCAFSKILGQEGAYTYSLGQAKKIIRQRLSEPITEVHIVGGLNPALDYEYYIGLIAAVKEARPEVQVKAYTAVEVAFLAQKYGKTTLDVLKDMQSAGLDQLPGGGAEVFSEALRKKICPEKISGKEWLEIHQQAHGQGLKTNATMLFGHIETWEDRIHHLHCLRDLQDTTHGFMCFIPLPYQPGNNPLKAKGTDGLDYIRLMAVSRLFLDNIPHLKAYWVYSGIKAAQVALWAGADDFDGTIVEEKIGHAAGTTTPSGMTVEELQASIRQAGFQPVQRDSFFQSIH